MIATGWLLTNASRPIFLSKAIVYSGSWKRHMNEYILLFGGGGEEREREREEYVPFYMVEGLHFQVELL